MTKSDEVYRYVTAIALGEGTIYRLYACNCSRQILEDSDSDAEDNVLLGSDAKHQEQNPGRYRVCRHEDS